MCLAQGPQRSGAGEARTRGPSISIKHSTIEPLRSRIYMWVNFKTGHKHYIRARKSKNPDVKIHYKRFRAHVQKVLRGAYWKHISNIFMF